VTIVFDPWDLDRKSGKADSKFDGEVIGTARGGYWIVRLDREVEAPDGSYRFFVLTPRYVGQPPISEATTFPYISATVYLNEAQAQDPSLIPPGALSKMPGLVGDVNLR
jgi:hypothetical protein